MIKNYYYYYHIEELLIIRDRFISPLLLPTSWPKALKKINKKKALGLHW